MWCWQWRGEVGGFVNSVGGPVGARRQWVDTGQMRILFNMEPEAVPWLGAPTIFDYLKTDEQRAVLTFFSGNTQLGRPLMAPPGVPADRVEALRQAFDSTMRSRAHGRCRGPITGSGERPGSRRSAARTSTR